MWISRRDVMKAGLAGAAGMLLARCGTPARPAATGCIIPDHYSLTDGHPRLYVTRADLPALRERVRTSDKRHLDSLLAFYEKRPALPPTTGPGARRRGGFGMDTEWIVRLSLLYLLTQDKAHAEAAGVYVERLLQVPVNGTYAGAQRRVRALGIAYDWLHDYYDRPYLLRIQQNIEECIAATYASGEAVDDGQYLAGHVANEVPQFFAAAITIGDEGNGRTMIDRSLKYLDRFLQNARFFLETDSFQQSYPYSCTYISEIATIFRLLETGLGQRPAPGNLWFENVVPWWLYPLRTDETFLRFGDYYGSIPLFDNPTYYRAMAYIATRYGNPHARWFAEQFRLEGRDEFHLLMYPSSDKDTPPAKSPENLPRTHFHERMGIAIARGDWNLKAHKANESPAGDTGGTVAAFKCSPYYLHNHCHRDANSIVIYHKGDLAIDSGMYDEYETEHWHNYYIRTIAHNTIVVHDPEEQFNSRGKVYSNDGGQRFINKPWFAAYDYDELLKSNAFKEGTIKKQRQAEDHFYVCGDASNCYNSAKVAKFVRHVTFILDHPHRTAVSLLVLDEIELARDGLVPRFLLHSVNEPAVSGSDVKIQNGQGRLTANFLSPVSIEKIGGEGKEWFVDGKNYAPRYIRPPHIPGAWRIEATPTAIAPRKFQIVTLLTPMDAAAPEPAIPQLQSSADRWVVQQEGLAVALYRGTVPGITGHRKILVPLA